MSLTLTQPMPAAGRRAPDASFHVVLLVLSASTIFLSCVLRVADEHQVILPILDIALPGTCTYQRFIGIDCPGCGLTRCFISIAHGDIIAAWRFNAAGLLGFVLTAAQIPYRAMQLFLLRRGQAEIQLGWLGQTVFWIFFALLFIQWGTRHLLEF